MAHGVVCHFDLPHMAQKVADWTRREGRPRADEMAHGAVCRFELPHVAENNRRVTRVDSSLWPQRTVPKLPSGTNGCQTLKTATLNTSYFCQKRPLCQPPPSPTPPPNSHFVRKVKLRLAYRLAFVTYMYVSPRCKAKAIYNYLPQLRPNKNVFNSCRVNSVERGLGVKGTWSKSCTHRRQHPQHDQ